MRRQHGTGLGKSGASSHRRHWCSSAREHSKQARLQVQGRDEGRYIYELLEPAEEKGLCSLPLPSLGDMFLDFEGDPFAFEQGLEYLFGVLTLADGVGAEPQYAPTWSLDRAKEKRAFENFIATVTERRRQYPDMHIYHYGAYEEPAIKRMAGRHGTCVDEVDDLLRRESWSISIELLSKDCGHRSRATQSKSLSLSTNSNARCN